MKKTFNLLFIAFLVLLTLLATTVCTEGGGSSGGGGGGSSGDDDGTTLYAIGDTGPSGVGIVFYITDGGLHGLEAAPSDQSASQRWITGGATQTTFNGNTSTEIGTGLANSNAIIAQAGHTGSAAQVCRNYNGGSLTDWFLPSQDELNELYKQKAAVSGLDGNSYWSSSEISNLHAWFQAFVNGAQDFSNKDASGRVRAIRAF